MPNNDFSSPQVLPWLRSIQACVPDSPVVLVATHVDRRPGLSGTTILQWEEVGIICQCIECVYYLSLHIGVVGSCVSII